MPSWLKFLLPLVAYAAVILIVYNVLKIYVLSKFRPNKWIVFAIAVAILTTPSAIKPGINNTPLGYGVSGVFLVLFLWFMDMFKEDNEKIKNSKNNIHIKPKAKPNRVKNKK